jgi:class 3 adenylate cyclase
VPTCAICGAENPARFRFCGNCGAPLVEAAPERRKTATLLFCDVSGSTALGERLETKAVREMMLRYFDQMRAVIARHGGFVEKFVGDAVLAVFWRPGRARGRRASRVARGVGDARALGGIER